MRKESLRSIIKEVRKNGETSRAFFVPTLEEVDYLVSKGILTEKNYETRHGLYGAWSSEYFTFTSL